MLSVFCRKVSQDIILSLGRYHFHWSRSAFEQTKYMDPGITRDCDTALFGADTYFYHYYKSILIN